MSFYGFSAFSEKEIIHKIWRLSSFGSVQCWSEVTAVFFLDSKGVKEILTTISIVELKY